MYLKDLNAELITDRNMVFIIYIYIYIKQKKTYHDHELLADLEGVVESVAAHLPHAHHSILNMDDY